MPLRPPAASITSPAAPPMRKAAPYPGPGPWHQAAIVLFPFHPLQSGHTHSCMVGRVDAPSCQPAGRPQTQDPFQLHCSLRPDSSGSSSAPLRTCAFRGRAGRAQQRLGRRRLPSYAGPPAAAPQATARCAGCPLDSRPAGLAARRRQPSARRAHSHTQSPRRRHSLGEVAAKDAGLDPVEEDEDAVAEGDLLGDVDGAPPARMGGVCVCECMCEWWWWVGAS